MTDLTKEMLPQVPQGGETKAGASGEDELGAYFREIRQYPRLTPEEERELAQGCAAGDQAAIRRMVQCNLRWWWLWPRSTQDGGTSDGPHS